MRNMRRNGRAGGVATAGLGSKGHGGSGTMIKASVNGIQCCFLISRRRTGAKERQGNMYTKKGAMAEERREERGERERERGRGRGREQHSLVATGEEYSF